MWNTIYYRAYRKTKHNQSEISIHPFILIHIYRDHKLILSFKCLQSGCNGAPGTPALPAVAPTQPKKGIETTIQRGICLKASNQKRSRALPDQVAKLRSAPNCQFVQGLRALVIGKSGIRARNLATARAHRLPKEHGKGDVLRARVLVPFLAKILFQWKRVRPVTSKFVKVRSRASELF